VLGTINHYTGLQVDYFTSWSNASDSYLKV